MQQYAMHWMSGGGCGTWGVGREGMGAFPSFTWNNLAILSLLLMFNKRL